MIMYLCSCILCIKFRWLARYHIYFVLTTRVMFTFVPTSAYRGMHEFIHCVNAIVVFVAHYCGSVLNIYCLTLVIIFEMFFSVHFAY